MRLNPLFFLVIVALGGCGTLPRDDAPSTARAAAPRHAPESNTASPDALFHALAALGVDYRYGGNSREQGFDCSGLVQHVYREAFGIELPRNTLAQSRAGRPVERQALEIGDLVFYNTLKQPYSHVGIYMGDGRFVHAPRTGAAVRVETMTSRYWASRYDGARRIVSTLGRSGEDTTAAIAH